MKMFTRNLKKDVKFDPYTIKKLGHLYVALKPSQSFSDTLVEVVRLELEDITSNIYRKGNLKIFKDGRPICASAKIKGRGYNLCAKLSESPFDQLGYSFDVEFNGEANIREAVLLLAQCLIGISSDEVRIYHYRPIA